MGDWFIGSDSYDVAPETNSMSLADATPAQIQGTVKATARQDYGALTTLFGDVAFGALDLVDTVASSVPGVSRATGLERGELSSKMLSAIDMPGLSKFYQQNQGGIEVASGVAGIIAADYVAGRVLKPAGKAMELIKKVPYVGRVASLDSQYRRALATVRNVDRALAKRGAVGVEQFIGEAMALKSTYNPATRMFGTESALTTRAAARNTASRLGIAKGLARNVTTEAIMSATLNQNSMLYDEDFGDNLFWMTAGLAIGGGVDKLVTNHIMKKAAVKSSLAKARVEAFDPGGIEGSRLLSSMEVAKGRDVDTTLIGSLNGGFTDQVTSIMIGAKNLQNEGNITGLGKIETGKLAGTRNRLATQQLELVNEEMQKATVKGVRVKGTAFSMNTPFYGNHVKKLLHDDPASMFGVELIGGIGDGMSIIGTHEVRVASLESQLDEVTQVIESGQREVKTRGFGGKGQSQFVPLTEDEMTGLLKAKKDLEFQTSLEPMVSISGEWLPLTKASVFDNFDIPEIQFKPFAKNAGGLWEVKDRPVNFNVGVDDKLNLFLPKGKTVDSADTYDMLRLYRAGDSAIRHMESTGAKMTMPENPSWFQLDMAEELDKRTGDSSLVQWPNGLTRETAMVESMAQKIDAIRGMKDLDAEKLAELRVRYNLPQLSAFEAGQMGTDSHPIEVLLRGAKSGDEIRKLPLSEIRKGLADVRMIQDFTDLAANEVESLVGDSFRFGVDDFGNPMKPILAYKRPLAPHEWVKDNLAERIAVRKHMAAMVLMGPEATPLNKTITGAVLQSPDYITASRANELGETSLQSAIPGFENAGLGSARGAWLNTVTSEEWRSRDNPTLLAAARVREMTERLTRSHMDQVIRGEMGDVISRVASPRALDSKLLLNQFYTFRGGWDLKPVTSKMVSSGKTFHGFTLQNTDKNRKRFLQVFGREMGEDETLKSPKGVAIVLDDLGLEAMTRFTNVAKSVRAEKNNLLKSQGLGEINEVDFYTPPPSTKGKYIGFTFDAENKVVPNGTIVASTPEEYARLENQMYDSGFLNKPGYQLRSRDEVTEFSDLWGKAQMDFIDPGTTAIQPGKQSKGFLQGTEIDMASWDNALLWMRDSFLEQGSDLSRVMFKEQLNIAQTRANIASASRRNAESGMRQDKYRGVYDFYIQAITGRSALSHPGSPVGGAFNWMEKNFNDLSRNVTPSVSKVWKGITDRIRNVVPWDSSKESRKQFDTLRDGLAEYMPFKDASEYIERVTQTAKPAELAKLTGLTSKFEAAWILRMLEVAHPIMNLTGMVNAMPSVVRHLAQREGESATDYASRIGHSAQIFELPDGRNIGTIDMAKIAHRAMKKAWSKASHADFEYMRSNGFITQEVAELHRQFGAIESKGTVMKFLTGDPHAKTGFASKGLVGWLSILSDKSEDFSRSFGHMAGLELAEFLGVKELHAKHAFAHDVANKMIANYSPQNRPEIFQGAVGTPIGLFQSFIWNYYQRMFRYIETGDKRALATQYATQGVLFGGVGLPGWQAMNKLFFDHSDGENSPYDAIYQRFGQNAGDLLMGGVLSNIPKIFSDDGVNLYSRGDTNIRLPGFNPPPFVNTAKRIYAGVGEAIQIFSDKNPHLTATQLGEVVANMMPNRPMAGAIEVGLLGGRDTDAHGQLVSQTEGWLDSTYRVLGLRSMQQSKALEAFYSNKSAQELQNAKRDALNKSSRAAIREGNFDALPDIFAKYVENGGDPRHYRRWIKSNYEAATTTRAERQLDSVMSNPSKMTQVQRLLDAEVSVDESETETETYKSQEEDSADDITRWENPDMPEEIQDPVGMSAADLTDPIWGSRM